MVLGSLIAAITNKEKEKRNKLSKQIQETAELEKQSQLTDEEILEVIGSEVKKRKEAKEQYEKGARPELAQKEQAELKILSEYLPPQLSEEELLKIVRETIAQLKGASEAKSPPRVDMGKVIGSVMAKVKGQADGSTVSNLIKNELSK